MVKVLIAHDRSDVLLQIREIVAKQGIDSESIQTVEDGQSLRQKLGTDLFDLAIVDLTLPAVKGKSEPGYSTVEDIFLQLYQGDGLNAPGDIIGISKVPDALARIKTTIGPHLMTVVAEVDDQDWKTQLADKVLYTLRSARARLLVATLQYDYDAAIITALDKELAPFRTIFELKEVDHFPGCYEFLFTDHQAVHRRGVAFSVGSAGQASCASAAQSIMARFRPRVFFLSGFCGGYEEKTTVGEVLLFRSTYDWDSGKWEIPKSNATEPSVEPIFLPRADPLSIGNGPMDRVVRTFAETEVENLAEVVEKLGELTNGEVSGLKVTPVLGASGSAVIANPTVLAKIRSQHDKIVAVDMESYGFYRACTHTPFARPEMLCVKAVADFCDGEKDDRFHIGCCYAAAKVVEDIIINRWHF